MSHNEHLLEFARKELTLINFDQSDLYEPILEFLKQSSKICNSDPDSMKQLVNILTRLIDGLPLAPITAEDFELEYHHEGPNTFTVNRCTRHPYIYSDENGKYWNDRAVSFRFTDSDEVEKMYLYSARNNSKQEITLPYYPVEIVKTIERF
jgi:hypothetical protein